MNINPSSVKAEECRKDSRQYDISFRMNDGLIVIFSDSAFHKIDSKAHFGFAI